MKPIKYSIAVPGSKSLMNRALLCAALANGRSVITNPVYCDDTNYMIAALQQCCVHIKKYKDSVVVLGKNGKLVSKEKIYLENAGTVKRFLTPFVPAELLVGNKRMSQRPNTDLEEAAKELGARGQVKITGQVSSQFISALLMYAPTLDQTTKITVTGKLVSAPYVQMTIQAMKQFGVRVKQYGNTFTVQPQSYRPAQYEVEGDASSATYWWALAAITGSHITVPNIPLDTLQPDAQFKMLLKKMGCSVKDNTVIGPWNGQLKAVQVNMSDYPDAVMSAAVVMTQAQGTSQIMGIKHLHYKESNRLDLLKLNLRKLGVSARTTIDSLTIIGRKQPLWSDKIITENDHRMAMAFTILGARVDNKNCVKKSYPTFWQDMQLVQRQAKRQTIVLTGMRGVGKTTYGKQLAKQFHMKLIDTDDGLFFRDNWKTFRDQEHRLIKKIYRKTNTVISTGGGALMFSRNVRLLKQHYTILLTAPLSVLKHRLARQSQRPTLKKNTTVVNELSQVWQERKEKYYQIADNVYDRR